jgi:hypothetical protein
MLREGTLPDQRVIPAFQTNEAAFGCIEVGGFAANPYN